MMFTNARRTRGTAQVYKTVKHRIKSAINAFVTFGVLMSNLPRGHPIYPPNNQNRWQQKLDISNQSEQRDVARMWDIGRIDYGVLRFVRVSMYGRRLLREDWEYGTCSLILSDSGFRDAIVYPYEDDERKKNTFRLVDRKEKEKYLKLYCSSDYTLLFTNRRILVFVGGIDFFIVSHMVGDQSYIDIPSFSRITSVRKIDNETYEMTLLCKPCGLRKYDIHLHDWSGHRTKRLEIEEKNTGKNGN